MLSTRFNRWTIAAVTLAALAAPGCGFGPDARTHGRQRRAIPQQDRSESADDVRQLSGRAPRQRRARRRFRRGILSLGAAHRSEEQRTAGPRLHLLAGRWRHRRGRQARRPHPDDGQVQPRRAAGGRRARPQAEEICRRAAQHQPVDPRTDHRSGGDAAVGLGELRRGRCQGGGRQYRQADRPGMVSDLQGSPHRHDPRDFAARKRMPARGSSAPTSSTIPCCACPTPMRAGCRATRTARRRPASTRRSTRSCRGIRWCRKGCATPRPARSCRRWSIRRRPARPRRCTASAPR